MAYSRFTDLYSIFKIKFILHSSHFNFLGCFIFICPFYYLYVTKQLFKQHFWLIIFMVFRGVQPNVCWVLWARYIFEILVCQGGGGTFLQKMAYFMEGYCNFWLRGCHTVFELENYVFFDPPFNICWLREAKSKVWL